MGGDRYRRRDRQRAMSSGCPRGTKRIEVDLVYLAFRVLVAIHRPFDHVPQLTHVARPWVSFELGERARRESRPIGPFKFHCHSPGKMLGKQGQVALARPEWRQRDD